jgi:hypothetical protein
MKEIYEDYILESQEKQMHNGRWSVGVKVSRQASGEYRVRIFREEKISLILPEEAAKEGINLGKNLIKRNLLGF